MKADSSAPEMISQSQAGKSRGRPSSFAEARQFRRSVMASSTKRIALLLSIIGECHDSDAERGFSDCLLCSEVRLD